MDLMVYVSTLKAVTAKAQREKKGRIGSEIVCHAPDSGAHGWRMEIEQQSELLSRHPQVGKDLRGVDRREADERLDLDDDQALDEKIDPIGIAEVNALVAGR
jgi:hypothetical protein